MSSIDLSHSRGPAADAAAPPITHSDPELRTLWAFRPCVINETDSRRGAWFQLDTLDGFAWHCVDLPVPFLPPALEGLRILHLSDLHLRARWHRAYDDLLGDIRRDPPDLLLVTGDYVEDKRNPRPALPTLARFLAGLTARLGCYGILGNHDITHRANPYLRSTTVTLIDGGRATVPVNGATVELIGLPGIDREELNFELLKGLPPKEHGALRVILSHYPDHIRRTVNLRPDLFLAGHTHGGQICLPGGYPLLRHDSLPRRLCKGIHRVGDTWLVVSNGFGFSGLPLRLFCPAEVVEMRLTR